MAFRLVTLDFRTIAAVAALLQLGLTSTTPAQSLAGLDVITPYSGVLHEVNANAASIPATEELSFYSNLELDLSFDIDSNTASVWELPEAQAVPSWIITGLSATWRDRSGWRAGGFVFNPAARDQVAFGMLKTSATMNNYSSDLEHPSLLTAGLGYVHAQGWRFGADVHLIDMVDTGGLDREGHSTDLNAMAIQWRSAPVVNLGGVIPLSDDLNLSSGFTWNRNQVRPLDHAFNALAPGLLQSSFHVGLRWRWKEEAQLFLNYRSGSANYLGDSATSTSIDLATGLEGAQDVASLTVGIELAL
ncbi:MAG: hypothetical protein QF489_09635 [Planctomycetota bacterium]|jgi:hypothetical protein|nr:hypothetical protein [Planctomycetota bacterium]